MNDFICTTKYEWEPCIHFCAGRKFAQEILDDVEEIHHWAIMLGDVAVMEKVGTLLNKYKKVR